MSSQAFNFSLDIQQLLSKRGKCFGDLEAMKKAIVEILPKYPNCIVADVITFSDKSVAILEKSKNSYAINILE